MGVLFGISANMDRNEILETVRKALAEKGMTAGEASLRAVGSDTLIANMTRERYGSPKVESLDALAKVLGLELYFGPPRDRGRGSRFMAEGGPDYSTPHGWVAPAFLEEAGQGRDRSEVALDRTWMEQRGLDPDKLAAVRVLIGGEVEGLDRDDLAILDTRDQALDGRVFAYFNGAMDRLRFARLLQLATGTIVLSVADGSPLLQLDRRAGMRVVGALVATFRSVKFTDGTAAASGDVT